MNSVLDSRQLLAARVLADTGSFTLTGQQLSLTQSAVSHAIKALEEEVECRLFHRTGKGVKVTAAGKHFLEYTDKILAQMETARTLVSSRTTHGKERLRLGVSNRARQIILPVVQPLFHREYPNRLVLIAPGEYRRNFQLIDSGLLDLSFTVRAGHRPDLEFVPLFEDELRFIVAATHPWARSGRASFDDLTRDTLMLFQDFNNTAELLKEHLDAEQVTPRHAVQLPDYESINVMVRTGRAVGVFSPFLVSKELQEGSLVSLQLGARPLRRQWGLTYLGNRHLGAMEKRLIELCQQAVPGILSRLQGQTALSREKKESPITPIGQPAAVAGANYARVAL
ncbi:HTH-type transcriptional activator CmpR [Lacunisphaera limnophila]|uniref:HTH-type transcriptional activator CmpR n=1 Tax=Lacunisphaera limnophila TaxID=1838286 RepID=A0A1D8AXX2_9BACT|nr:LysR family transcriptional regulator [Lacunisphaera limnophila]AOS45724.1 HTH-type transcriptional activator CmpR [Lacunisphaera limnophila]